MGHALTKCAILSDQRAIFIVQPNVWQGYLIVYNNVWLVKIGPAS